MIINAHLAQQTTLDQDKKYYLKHVFFHKCLNSLRLLF